MAVVLLVLAACSTGPASYTNQTDRISLSYPAAWRVTTDSLTPNLGFPMLVAVSTFAAPPGGGTCAHVAANALDAIGPTDVLLTIHELPFAYADGPRPDDLRTRADIAENDDVWECMTTDPLRLTGGHFRFFEGNRTFDVVLAIGEGVSAADKDAAWAMLESFTVLTGAE